MLLLYCMCELGSIPATGIRGTHIRHAERDDVVIVYSDFTPSPDSVKDDALAFHQTNQQIFQNRIIIPFRFPTTLPDEAAARDFLNKHAAEYRAELERLRPFVQMDVLITEQREHTVDATSG